MFCTPQAFGMGHNGCNTSAPEPSVKKNRSTGQPFNTTKSPPRHLLDTDEALRPFVPHIKRNQLDSAVESHFQWMLRSLNCWNQKHNPN
mmetsp:Transcript_30053/g.48291  ORF Transcript_30053/g.48291 Transcript_30053/m.48291 type:complete len:89 (+) Transcript_30053:382-648(+)